MFYGAKNGNLKIGKTDMDFITFGKGEKKLVIVPGLSDGLQTVKGRAAMIAIMYRIFAKDYKVYIFSRKNEMEEGYSTKDMARDLKFAMDNLGIKKTHIMGLSQGGMISQHLAINYPEVIEKLVLAVTVSRQNETIQKVIGGWISMAEKCDFKTLNIDSLEKTYSEKAIKKYRLMYPFLSLVKPKSNIRFITQAKSCINHNAYDELHEIKIPTLVIGGDNDLVVGKNTSEEIAERIPNSRLIIYKGLGHGAFDEAKDFNKKVLNFLNA